MKTLDDLKREVREKLCFNTYNLKKDEPSYEAARLFMGGIDSAIDHLHAQGRIVPDGYVAVPLEPTVDMWEAGVCARRKAHNYALADQVDDIYKAMIAAARKDEK